MSGWLRSKTIAAGQTIRDRITRNAPTAQPGGFTHQSVIAADGRKVSRCVIGRTAEVHLPMTEHTPKQLMLAEQLAWIVVPRSSPDWQVAFDAALAAIVEVEGREQRCPSCGAKFQEILDVDAYLKALP